MAKDLSYYYGDHKLMMAMHEQNIVCAAIKPPRKRWPRPPLPIDKDTECNWPFTPIEKLESHMSRTLPFIYCGMMGASIATLGLGIIGIVNYFFPMGMDWKFWLTYIICGILGWIFFYRKARRKALEP